MPNGAPRAFVWAASTVFVTNERDKIIGSVSRSTPSVAAAAAPKESAVGTAGLRNLSVDDWKVISAAVGKTVGPESNGSFPGAYPAIDFTLAFDRQHGWVPAGTVTSSYFACYLTPGQDPEMAKQYDRAIEYLTSRASTATTTRNTALDITG